MVILACLNAILWDENRIGTARKTVLYMVVGIKVVNSENMIWTTINELELHNNLDWYAYNLNLFSDL